jgi:hypothetical protein
VQLRSMSVDKLVKLKDQVEEALSSKVKETRRTLEMQLSHLTRFGKGSPLARQGNRVKE